MIVALAVALGGCPRPTATPPPAPAGAPPALAAPVVAPDAAFRAWVEERALSSALAVQQWGGGRDPDVRYWATLCGAGTRSYLVETVGGARWTLPAPPPGDVAACDGPDRPVWRRSRNAFRFAWREGDELVEANVGIRGGRAVMLRLERTGPTHGGAWDYDACFYEEWRSEGGETLSVESPVGACLGPGEIPLVAAGEDFAQAQTFVIEGEQDAELRLYALPREGGVELHVDIGVPVLHYAASDASAAAFDGADHLEVHFGAPTRRLAVGWSREGALVLRWLGEEAVPLPTVEQRRDGLVVLLDDLADGDPLAVSWSFAADDGSRRGLVSTTPDGEGRLTARASTAARFPPWPGASSDGPR